MKIILVHGGAGASLEFVDGCDTASSVGIQRLLAGGTALDAVIDAVVTLEDDERFNAGTGSALRLDGETIEMDAAIMDSTGLLGAVAAIPAVKNPVLVARRVADTPHVLLAGEGAQRFAERAGFQAYRQVTAKAQARHQVVSANLRHKGIGNLPKSWGAFDAESYWNFAKAYADVNEEVDTVGAVAMDDLGHFAVATSTGGSVPMLAGRVGDTPLMGCGFYVGLHGAVAATGIGEEIIRHMVSRTVYDAIRLGEAPQDACDAAVDAFAVDLPIGVIAISSGGHACASNVPMATSMATES